MKMPEICSLMRGTILLCAGLGRLAQSDYLPWPFNSLYRQLRLWTCSLHVFDRSRCSSRIWASDLEVASDWLGPVVHCHDPTDCWHRYRACPDFQQSASTCLLQFFESVPVHHARRVSHPTVCVESASRQANLDHPFESSMISAMRLDHS